MVTALTVVGGSDPAAAAATGVTVAGGNGYGSAANQLSEPIGLAVDRRGNVYIADVGNDRVQRWAPGAAAGVTVAGGRGHGSSAVQLAYPLDVALDDSGNLYVADSANHRIQRWAPGATTGVTVAGGNGLGDAADQLSYPTGLDLDQVGNIYVSDSANFRVQPWAPGATVGTTVAGGNGFGAAADQIGEPTGIAVDARGQVYVVDREYDRVQRWAPGATVGVTVAGGTGPGSAANQLWHPFGATVDSSGNVYVTDSGNDRLQMWAPGATGGVTVAGGYGSAPDQLAFPEGVELDDSGNIYVADSHNRRVQRFPAFVRTVLPGGGVVTEPSSGSAALEVSVSLDAPPTDPVTVAWDTIDLPGAPPSAFGPAAPPSDYTAASGVVTFAPGQSTTQVTISVNGNSTGANYEYVAVRFHDATGARVGGFGGIALGLIESAAHAALLTMLPGTGTVTASPGGVVPLDVPVTLSAPSVVPVTVEWNTLYVPAAPPTTYGPQAPPSDYSAVSGTVTFDPGQTTAHVTVFVTGNSHQIGPEYLLVSFHDPTPGAKMGGFWGLGIGVIGTSQ